MRPDDIIRLKHMLDAANEAISFVKEKSQNNFKEDRMVMLAVIKEIEIIGEAANKVSEDVKIDCPNVPWKNIIGMRNRLIHGYFDVDDEIIWNTVMHDLPSLIEVLKTIISE